MSCRKSIEKLEKKKLNLSSAVGAPGSKEHKNQFCMETDRVDSSAGVLQSSANSAFAELIRRGPEIIMRCTLDECNKSRAFAYDLSADYHAFVQRSPGLACNHVY